MPDQFLHGVETVQIDNGIRAIRTVKSSVICIVGTAPAADLAVFPQNMPVLCKGPNQAASLDDDGTLKDAYLAAYAQGVNAVILINVPEGADAAATKANIVGDATTSTGCYAMTLCKAVTGFDAKILVAPGFTTPADPSVKDPVAAVLEALADRLNAIAYVAGPNTTEADAINYRDEFGQKRLMIIDPYVRVYDQDTATYVTRPPEAYMAGVRSRTDNELGYWHSASNKLINGIVGTARPISFGLTQADTEANRLNENEITTIINDTGYRFWGNRGTSADAQWAFLAVTRTNDLINESIAKAHLWAMDRPMSAQLFKDIMDSVQAYGDRLVSLGALLGFRIWLDEELNTEAELKAGKLYLNYELEPPAPLEHLIFRVYRNGEFYDDLIAETVSLA